MIETGSNSSVSEIETPEVIETVVTISPDLTHEEIHHGESVEVSTASETNEIEIVETEPPQVIVQETPNQLTTDDELPEHQQPESSTPSIAENREREGKVSDDDGTEEDNYIDVDFASRLDFSCLEESGQVLAPSIVDGRVISYNT